ncbi:MAG: type III pantothenate kinase [Clostridiaceae bacterium]
MSGILTLDIGNSNIVTVLYDRAGNRLADDRQETIKEENYRKYKEFFQSINTSLPVHRPDAVILSCVVPYVRETVYKVMAEVYPDSVLYRVAPGMVPDMTVCLEEPRELGADIAATTVGAYHKYKELTIIADLGSATKLGVVDEAFNMRGGIIMPGIAFQARSLHQMIPHLPDIELKRPAKVIGDNTIHSIQSGIINGSLGAIIELGRAIEKELGQKCHKLITGGLAKLFQPEDLQDFEYDEFLLSDGLYHIANYWLNSPTQPEIYHP